MFVSLTVSSALAGQPRANPVAPEDLAPFRELTQAADQVDWEEETVHLQRTIDNIWDRYEWKDESDRFARDLALKLAAIPPWKPLVRLETMYEGVERRYGLEGASRARFRQAVMRETANMLMRNADVVVAQTREWLEMRANRQPMTPEQVARWAKEGAPLMEAMRDSVNRVASDLTPLIQPDKRRLLERDLRSYQRRHDTMEHMAERWAQGKWRPEDWGLEDDPVQQGFAREDGGRSGEAGREHTAGAAGRSAPAVKPCAYDPRTWHAYVIDFELRFRLDPGQCATANSIHAELVARATRYMTAHEASLVSITEGDRESHDAFAPVRNLYQELLDRLDALPTSGQRAGH